MKNRILPRLLVFTCSIAPLLEPSWADTSAGKEFTENFNSYDEGENFAEFQSGWEPLSKQNPLVTTQIATEAESAFTKEKGGKGWLFKNPSGKEAGTAHGAIHTLTNPAAKSFVLEFDFRAPDDEPATLNPVVIIQGIDAMGEIIDVFHFRLAAHARGEFGYQTSDKSPVNLTTIDRDHWYRANITIADIASGLAKITLKRDDGEEDSWGSIPLENEASEISKVIFRPSFNQTGVGVHMWDNFRIIGK